MIDLHAAPFDLSPEQIAWVDATRASMTREEKLGQLFCVMGGDYAPERLKEMAADGRIGGVLFRPVETAQTIREHYNTLDEAAKIPLLKAANLEEGGSGGMSDGTLLGWPMLSAAADDLNVVDHFGKVCAMEGRKAGINWTFSPVCDLDLNYLNPITNVRTYGSNTSRVQFCTRTYMQAVQNSGMAACAKHFPGDGVDYRDQHLHPTYNTLTATEWYASYGTIYENLIQNGLLSVMVGHICQPALSMEQNPALTEADCLPATLSPELLTGVLRGKLGFNGVITTDATIMGGYCMAMPRREALPASIMAGCDMLVFSTDYEEDYGYLLAALEDGRLTEKRLDDAVIRVLGLKAKVCFDQPVMEDVQAAQWHWEAANKAITLVKQLQPDALPISPECYPALRLICLGRDETPDGLVSQLAREYLENNGFAVELYDPYQDELHGASQLSDKRLTLYFANYEQASNQTVVRIAWCPKHALDMPRFVHEEPSIFVSLANPYLLQDVPRVKTYINAYTATRATIQLTIDKLMGRSDFVGISPVDPFCGLIDTHF